MADSGSTEKAAVNAQQPNRQAANQQALAQQMLLIPVSIRDSNLRSAKKNSTPAETANPFIVSQPVEVASSSTKPSDEFMPAQAGPEIVHTNTGLAKPDNAWTSTDSPELSAAGPHRASRPNSVHVVEPLPHVYEANGGWLATVDPTVATEQAENVKPAAYQEGDLSPFPGAPSLPTETDESDRRDGTDTDTVAQTTELPSRRDAGRNDDGEQTLGEEPPENDQPLQFLRRQTVLLEPGEHQFDVGINYLNDMADFPVLLFDAAGDVVGVAEGKSRQRLLVVPLELRVGIGEYTQAFANVPFGWSNTEVAFNGKEDLMDEGGIGDVSAGLTQQIVIGNEYYPDVLASVAFSAPTGNSSVSTALGTPGSTLGQGFYTLTTSLNFIQSFDPVVFFYGGGYTFRFESTFRDTIEIDPGDQVFYRFGAGFAVNPHVTLSAVFTGAVIGRDEVNRAGVAGSVREPMSVRLAATISRRKSSKTHKSFQLVEPFVNFGLNEDSVDSFIGITWTH